jgi:hypothetical protein
VTVVLSSAVPFVANAAVVTAAAGSLSGIGGVEESGAVMVWGGEDGMGSGMGRSCNLVARAVYRLSELKGELSETFNSCEIMSCWYDV